MSETKNASTVESLRHAFQRLNECCLYEKDGFNPVRIVAYGGDDSEYLYGPEGSGLSIFENADGRFGILEDWEDSTGHGCQCGSSLTWFASEEMSWRLGVTKEQRDWLKSNGFTGPEGEIEQ